MLTDSRTVKGKGDLRKDKFNRERMTMIRMDDGWKQEDLRTTGRLNNNEIMIITIKACTH